jgi:hypothetical protein
MNYNRIPKHIEKFYFLPTTKDLIECPKISIHDLELTSESGQTVKVVNIKKNHLIDLGHSIFLFNYYLELDGPLFPELDKSLYIVADFKLKHANIQNVENFNFQMLENCNLIAHPEYYDYIHSLLFRDGEVEMCDGGGQIINGVWEGKFIIDPKIKNITCEYFKFKNYEDITPINIKKSTEILKIRQGDFSFVPYSHNSIEHFEYEITLNSSLCPISSNRKYNLFNIQEDDTYPLVFYFNRFN